MARSAMGRRTFCAALAAGAAALVAGCAAEPAPGEADAAAPDAAFGAGPRAVDGYELVPGERTDRGFVADETLTTSDGHALHFSLSVPDGYDGSAPYGLYVACPGWEGLYFQGVGANLAEDFPFVARDYVDDLIVASPQLDGWDEQSAFDVIELTEWLLSAYNVDAARVWLSGCSGGGETISYALGLRPELYRRALHAISRWDGSIDALAAAEVPVYLAIGENDDYYGSELAREAAEQMRAAYRARGLSEGRIDELVVLDVKPTSYFVERGLDEGASQHAGGGALFPHDEQIMGWLFQ